MAKKYKSKADEFIRKKLNFSKDEDSEIFDDNKIEQSKSENFDKKEHFQEQPPETSSKSVTYSPPTTEKTVSKPSQTTDDLDFYKRMSQKAKKSNYTVLRKTNLGCGWYIVMFFWFFIAYTIFLGLLELIFD